MPINDKYLAKFEPGKYYHIYNRCVSMRELFIYPDNYYHFLQLLKKYLEGSLNFLSYCLIPNHFHLFAQVQEIFIESDNVHKIISEQFRRMFIAYANGYNKRFHMHGGLFEYPFKRVLVDTDSYFFEVIRYIHQNPVHHGMPSNVETYPFSSYNSFLSDKPTILKRDFILDTFGGREGFIDFHSGERKSYKDYPFYIENFADIK